MHYVDIFSELTRHFSDGGSSGEGSAARSDSPTPSAPLTSQEETEKPPDPELEKSLLGYLSDLSLSLPTESLAITNELGRVSLLQRETQGCSTRFPDFMSPRAHSLKVPSVMDASRACCLNSLLRSSSRFDRFPLLPPPPPQL